MQNKKRAQISTEYLIIITFIVFIVITILGTAFFYASEIKDAIKFSQLDRFSKKITTSAEAIFYAGEPSQITTTAYLPDGIIAITILNNEIIFEVSTSAGTAKISYSSKVALEGSISNAPGIKKLKLAASSDRVTISQA